MTDIEAWADFSARWTENQQERAAGNWARMAAAQGIDPFTELPTELHAAARAAMERNKRPRVQRMPPRHSRRSQPATPADRGRTDSGELLAYEHSEDAVPGAEALDGLTSPDDIVPVIEQLALRHGVAIDSPVPYRWASHGEMTRRPNTLTTTAGEIITLKDGRRLWAIRAWTDWDEDHMYLHEYAWGPIVTTRA